MSVRAIAGAASAAPAASEREFPTPEQMEALRIRMARNPTQGVSVWPRPFDLPRDYLLCTFSDGFTCGIDPEGRVSS